MSGKTRMFRGLATLSAATCLTVLLAGCGATPEPPPPPGIIQLSLIADGTINPDDAGTSSPVSVRIYQLASREAFGKADYFQLADDKSLGTDVAARDDIILVPGETRTYTRPLQPNARYLGIVAGFRAIDHAIWRGLADVPEHGTSQFEAHLSGTALTLAGPKS